MNEESGRWVIACYFDPAPSRLIRRQFPIDQTDRQSGSQFDNNTEIHPSLSFSTHSFITMSSSRIARVIARTAASKGWWPLHTSQSIV